MSWKLKPQDGCVVVLFRGIDSLKENQFGFEDVAEVAWGFRIWFGWNAAREGAIEIGLKLKPKIDESCYFFGVSIPLRKTSVGLRNLLDWLGFSNLLRLECTPRGRDRNRNPKPNSSRSSATASIP